MLKVKPFLLLIFLTVFVALFTTACSDTSSSSAGLGGGIYDDSTNPGGSDTENPGGSDTENPGGSDTENPDVEEDKPGVTAIDLAGNPFSLLGVYDVTLYGIDGEPNTTPAAKSELRVGLNLATAEGGMAAPEVIMYLDFEGKQITFDKYIIELSDLANSGGDLGQFIADTFANLGAELIENSKYGLYFTLDPNKNPNYSLIIDNLIIKNGQYLKLKLDKTKDLAQDGGLGLDEDTTTNPDEPTTEPEEPATIPVDSVSIKGQPETVVHGGASFQLTAEVLPNDATNKIVTWESSNPNYISVDTQGNVTIKGYTEETITITATSTADKTKTASWQFNIAKAEVTNIIVNPDTLEMQLRNDDIAVETNITTAIEPSIATDYTPVTYEADDSGVVSVDNTGKVIALQEGKAVITVTAGGLIKQVNVTVLAAPVLDIPVTGINVTSQAKVYKTNSNITIEFEITPADTTDQIVSYTVSNGLPGGNVTTTNGKGTLTLSKVTSSGTVTFTTLKNHTAKYELQIVDEVASISFENKELIKEQDTVFTNNIVNKSSIENSIAYWSYSSDDSNIASVDASSGQVTANKNGVTTIRVTAYPKYDAEPLTAEFQIDVLGHIDYTDASSLQGTYDIIFFGTNTNDSQLAKAVISSDCSLYNNFKWNNDFACPSGTGGYEIPDGDFVGRALVRVDNGIVTVNTKVGFIGSGTIQSMSADDQYQYTNYPSDSLSGYLNTNNTGNLTGRHLSDKTTSNNATYYLERDVNYTGMTKKDIVLFTKISKTVSLIITTKTIYPDTRLVLRKISSKIIPMNPNTLTESPFDVLQSKLNLDSSASIDATIN